MDNKQKLKWHKRRLLKQRARNAANYFELILMDNAMPVIKGAHPLPLHDRDIRERVRRALASLIDEGELAGKSYDDIEYYINHCIAVMNTQQHYNPYRDTTLACIAMMNVVNYVASLRQQQFGDSRFFKSLMKPFEDRAPAALMHIYGKQLPATVRQTFPKLAQLYDAFGERLPKENNQRK